MRTAGQASATASITCSLVMVTDQHVAQELSAAERADSPPANAQ